MKARVVLFNGNNSPSPFEGTAFEFNLKKRTQIFMFCTTWFGLSKEDYSNYEEISLDKIYMKLYINEVKAYSGVILQVDELQVKLKHLTRIDKPKEDLRW